jgi:lysophospholipase L1-like esterase
MMHAATIVALLIAASTVAMPAQNPAIVPVPQDGAVWMQRHETILQRVKCDPGVKLVMIGDSITQNYERAEPPYDNLQPIWQQFYTPRNALNLGVSGDTTANVLWRLDHGEIDGIAPVAAVILIGTNNTFFKKERAAQTEAGIDAVVAKVEQKLPKAHLILLGILPNGGSPSTQQADREINHYLAARYQRDPSVTYLDIGSIFLKDGEVDNSLFSDPHFGAPALHPNTTGQRMMAEAIEPTLDRVFGDEPPQPSAPPASCAP